ncbi:hypothetical protein HYC85_028876 [Camellia sinensis]|uniref:Uncharacterized protein n=1 Tax=Camellia sinensis TaxID=4442 RepID=A0A7J7FWH4_CAMSI|nr:hypothetical protein HYC85_028876 [Camellia sinensis]
MDWKLWPIYQIHEDLQQHKYNIQSKFNTLKSTETTQKKVLKIKFQMWKSEQRWNKTKGFQPTNKPKKGWLTPPIVQRNISSSSVQREAPKS